MIVLEWLFLTIAPCDAAEPWQLGSQDAATPMMQGIMDLHHDIFFFLILILVFVLRILVRALWHFHYQKNPIPQRIVHGTTIEILRTIFPSIIPMFIAIPSFVLLYSMDEVIVDPAITIKAIGHQGYRTYEYSDYNSSDEQSLTFDSYTIPEDDLEFGQSRLLDVDRGLVVPAKTNLRIIVTSADVPHSYRFPCFFLPIAYCDSDGHSASSGPWQKFLDISGGNSNGGGRSPSVDQPAPIEGAPPVMNLPGAPSPDSLEVPVPPSDMERQPENSVDLFDRWLGAMRGVDEGSNSGSRPQYLNSSPEVTAESATARALYSQPGAPSPGHSSTNTEDSFGIQVLMEGWPIAPNSSIESSMQQRILELENGNSPFLLDKEKGEYWQEISSSLRNCSCQNDYDRLLVFENRDLRIRELKHSCYTLFKQVLSQNPALAENAAVDPMEVFIDFLEAKRTELDKRGGDVLVRDRREIRFLRVLKRDLLQHGPNSAYINTILGG